MSRIGTAPVVIPANVTITIDNGKVMAHGPKGESVMAVPAGVTVEQAEGKIVVKNLHSGKAAHALHGFIRAQIANDLKGITQGWTKTLELSGVGYRASLSGTNLVLNVGFSHQVTVTPPPGIMFAVPEGKIVVSGTDKHLVGQVAANIRAIKEPEPYKGKGIKYQNEHIRKKAGKAAKAVGGAGGGK